MQIDAFILQGPPEAFDEEVIDEAPFAVHRDPGAGPCQPVGQGKGVLLATLICVHDLERAELVDRLIQRCDAEVGLKRVQYPPGQHLAGIPVHEGGEIEGATAQGQVGDIGAPTARQRISFMSDGALLGHSTRSPPSK